MTPDPQAIQKARDDIEKAAIWFEENRHKMEATDEGYAARSVIRALLDSALSAKAGEKDYTIWLLEKEHRGRILYLYYDEWGFKFTPDANKAIHFARREDADAVGGGSDDFLRVVEHMWPDVKPRAVPPSPVADAVEILERVKGCLLSSEYKALHEAICHPLPSPQPTNENMREQVTNVANALELMAYTSAGKDTDLSKFLAIQAGRLQSALTAPHVEGWRPIESAPKDGRIAIYYRPLSHLSNDPHVAVKRSCSKPQHVWAETIPDGADGLNYNDGSCYATHWMPLPAAPEVTGE